MLYSLLTLTSFSHMYADFKLKFNLQFLPFEHFRYVYSSVLIQPLRSHRLDPARPMSMHGPLHGCSTRPNLEAVKLAKVLLRRCMYHRPVQSPIRLLIWFNLDAWMDSKLDHIRSELLFMKQSSVVWFVKASGSLRSLWRPYIPSLFWFVASSSDAICEQPPKLSAPHK